MLQVAVAGLLAHRFRLILTAATIALGVALVAGTFILTDSVAGALGSSAGPAQVVVLRPGPAGGKGPAAPASLPASLVRRVRAVRGVARAEGLVTADKVVLTGPRGRPVLHRRAVNELLSYPAIPALAAQYTIQAGRPPRRPDEALLDAATAHRLGYRVGTRIEVGYPTGGSQTLTVVGVTGFGGADSPPDTQLASFDTPTVLVVQPATAQRLAVLPGGFTEIDAAAAPGVPASALARRLTRLLPPGAAALTAAQAAAQLAGDAVGHLDSLRTDLLAFSAVALLVGAFIIASTFAVLTAQRTREYALLRVIGVSRGQLLRSALAEAALLGLAASAAGTGLGVLAAAALRGLIAVLGGTLPPGGLVVAPHAVAVALATGVVVTVAAALRPARLAARVLPVRALRDALPGPPRYYRGRRLAGLAGLAAAVALLATGPVAQNPALVGAGGLLAVAGVVIAAPLIAGPAAHLITAPMAYARGRPRRVPVTVALARDNITANPQRTAVTAAILTIGLAAAAALSIVATSARASARAAIDGSSRADLYVQGSINPRLARAVAAQPGVRATMRLDYPLVEVAGARVRVDGIDPGRAALLMSYGVRAGALTALRGNVVMVSTLQADRHGWHIGSPVTIDFGQGGPRTLRVAGTFTDRRFTGDDYLLPLATLFRDMPAQLDSSDLVLVRAAAGIRPGAIRSGIGNLLRGYPGDSVLTATQYQHGRAADLGDVSHVLGVLTALVTLTVLVATLGLANALALSVAERAGEFGVLRALGLTRRELAAMIRAEAVLTCLLGALPGAAIGAEAGAGLAAALTRGQTGVATIAVSPGQLTAAIAVTCLAALLAGIVPGRRAGRVPALRAAQ